MKLKKLFSLVAAGIATIGTTSTVIFTSSSCSKNDEGLISLVSTETTILNKATYTFKVLSDIPENIKLVWIKNNDISKKVKIPNNHEIPVDQQTGEFQVGFEVIVQPKEWASMTFDLSFQYEVEQQTHTTTISHLSLNNGTTQIDCIKPMNGSAKLITSTENEAYYTFYFDTPQTGLIPEKINHIEITNISDKYKDVVRLGKTEAEVDSDTKLFNIPIGLTQEINEVVTFSFTLSYDWQGKNYCFFTDDLSLIFYKQHTEGGQYLGFRSDQNGGTISYTCTDLTQATNKNLFYRINNSEYWSFLSLNEQVYVPPGGLVQFAGINDYWSNSEIQYYFQTTHISHLAGSPESLIHGGTSYGSVSGDFCFAKLFMNCTSIRFVSEDFLSMRHLTNNCYESMFDGCTSLTCDRGFELPAKVLQPHCYRRLFANTKINKIKYLANITPNIEYCFQWLDNIDQEECIFNMPSDVDISQMERSTSTVPNDWTISTFNEPLTIIAKENCSVRLVGYKEDGTIDPGFTQPNKDIEYSYDYHDESFKKITTIFTKSISLKKDEYIYLRGNNEQGWYDSHSDTHHIGFKVSGESDLAGNVISLIYPNLDNKSIPWSGSGPAGFCQLFSGSEIQFIGPLVLDVSGALPNSCFKQMFKECEDLLNVGSISKLIAQTTLETSCFEEMFNSCSSLETINVDEELGLAPQSLKDSCYKGMFSDCISLKVAPKVIDKDITDGLQPHCFESMFENCISIETSAPVVGKITRAAQSCYSKMFKGCVGLLECPQTKILPPYEGRLGKEMGAHCMESMYQNCSAIADIPDIYLPIGYSHGCESMFESCNNLKSTADSSHKIKISKKGTYDWDEGFYDNCFKNMFAKCLVLAHVHLDMDGYGPEFKDIDDSTSIFENWLPKEQAYAQDRSIWLHNTSLNPNTDLPEGFVISNWKPIKVEINLCQQPKPQQYQYLEYDYKKIGR